MGLISMLSLDLLAQDKNIPEELKPYYEAYYKKRFAFVQGLFKNAGDPDFRKEAFSSNKKIKIRPKRSKKSKEPLPWDALPSPVPVDIYETIFDSLSLSVSSINWYSDKIDSEIKVSMHYDVPEIWKENSDMTISQSGTKQYHGWPELRLFGDTTIGLQTTRADGVILRFVSKIVDHENKPVHLRAFLDYERKPIKDIHGNCISIDETYKMILDRPLSEIKSGTLYIGVLKNEYRRVKVTSGDINKQFTLGEVPFTLLSFKNGTAIISSEPKYYNDIRYTWFHIGMKNGVPLEHPHMLQFIGYSYTLYDNIVNNPTYSFQDFMEYVVNKGYEEKMVCVYPFYAPVNEIYFYIPLMYNKTMLLEKEIKVK